MENNNSKQILFSIIGIAILIIAVVGVSFAFFTYSRTGTSNNVITTGKIVFNFDDPDTNPSGSLDDEGKPQTGQNLTLSNAEPMDDDTGKAQEDKFGFGIEANIPEALEDINFQVYLIKGSVPSGTKPLAAAQADGTLEEASKGSYTEADRLDYKYVSVMVAASDKTNTGDGTYGLKGVTSEEVEKTIVEAYKNDNGSYALTSDINSENGLKVAEGTLKKGEDVFYAYTLTLWINDTLKVSDTDETAPYRASRTTTGLYDTDSETTTTAENDTRPIYSDLFYSVKVKIVAGDAIGVNP